MGRNQKGVPAMKDEKKTKKKTTDVGEWIVFGLLGGTIAGILLGNPPMGMIAGICLGILIGSIWPI